MAKNYKQIRIAPRMVREDMPLTKMTTHGKRSLTNSELVAILIANGDQQEALDIARLILDKTGNSLNALAKLSIMDMAKIEGVTPRKASIITAALELGNRKRYEDVPIQSKIAGSRDVYEILYPEMGDAAYETFWVILLNRANKIIRKINISEGGVSGTVADPKRIFKMALDHNASSVIMAHNHPSGNVQPSEADIKLTRKLKDAGLLLDLPVLDHLILGGESYFSFADEGMI